MVAGVSNEWYDLEMGISNSSKQKINSECVCYEWLCLSMNVYVYVSVCIFLYLCLWFLMYMSWVTWNAMCYGLSEKQWRDEPLKVRITLICWLQPSSYLPLHGPLLSTSFPAGFMLIGSSSLLKIMDRLISRQDKPWSSCLVHHLLHLAKLHWCSLESSDDLVLPH